MIKFQKKPILLTINQPTYIRKEANAKHNEVTVVLMHCAMPLKNIFYHKEGNLSRGVITAALKEAKKFPEIEADFNGNAVAITFIVKAKTERRGDDVHNQELADRIALTKANIRACAIARRIMKAIGQYICEEVAFSANICETIDNYSARETAYIHKIWS